jgi:hypothetical protein
MSISSRSLPSIGRTLVALGALASCQGITQSVETLRAERVEIVDDKGAVKVEVAAKLASLEARVQKLEAALAAQSAAKVPSEGAAGAAGALPAPNAAPPGAFPARSAAPSAPSAHSRPGPPSGASSNPEFF